MSMFEWISLTFNLCLSMDAYERFKDGPMIIMLGKILSQSLLLHLLLLVLSSSTDRSHGQHSAEGSTEFGSNGFLKLTNTTKHSFGHIFYSEPLIFKNPNGTASSFSLIFFFAIVPEHKNRGSHGMSFVISPTRGIPGASPDQYLGIFTKENNGNASNHIVSVELDIHKDEEFGDIDDNHVGININGLRSLVSAPAGYYDEDGNFKNLSLISKNVMRISISYSQPDKQLNVTLSPAEMVTQPLKPLLSLNQDLSLILSDDVYIGFSASTGSIGAIHYMLGYYIFAEVVYPTLDLGRVPIMPPYPKKSSQRTRVLVACLTLSVFVALVASAIGVYYFIRHRQVKEVLEEWEIQYGPHRFAYKELLKATKYFKEKNLLGQGGFGQVYKGILPGSGNEIAVKQISQGSRQGMREFLAEIATIGRLRHPNLVRLLGYSRHKDVLYLVYDFMPNGSLDKFLYRSPDEGQLKWEQCFKIIKDIASALFYLHQGWVQIIIHGDIKPANVLIDHEMNAKLGDFGLAKLYDRGYDPHTTDVAGTIGYIAPELVRTGKATTSTDVYAFGLCMLEVGCGRRLIERRAEADEVVLVDWILKCWEKGNILEAARGRVGQEHNKEQLELVLKLGLLCSHPVAVIRPDMANVTRILDGVSQLPDNLLDMVKVSEYKVWADAADGVSGGFGLHMFSTPNLTTTESFVAHGR